MDDVGGYGTINQHRPRSRGEYRELAGDASCLVVVVIAIINWGGCPASPSLQWFALCFGLFTAGKGFLGFYWRVPKDTKKQNLTDPHTNIYNNLGILFIPLSIWGCCASFPFTSDVPMYCDKSLFTAAAICAAIPMLCIVALLSLALYRCGQPPAGDPEGMNEVDEEGYLAL